MRTLATALLAITLIVTGAAFAADKPKKEGAFGKGGGAMLTKEQLRSCMNQKAKVAQQEEDLTREQAALATTKGEIGRSGEALKAGLETLDRTNAEAVAAYNDQAQARVTAFNGRVEAGQADREAYAKGCENRRFFEEDELAIKKGK